MRKKKTNLYIDALENMDYRYLVKDFQGRLKAFHLKPLTRLGRKNIIYYSGDADYPEINIPVPISRDIDNIKINKIYKIKEGEILC